jgi:hypothetical protein
MSLRVEGAVCAPAPDMTNAKPKAKTLRLGILEMNVLVMLLPD